MKKIIILFTVVALYSFTGYRSETETGFSETCAKLSVAFRKDNHGRLVYNQTDGRYIQHHKFAKILTALGKYGLENHVPSEKSHSGKIEKLAWVGEPSEKTIRLEKATFKSSQQTGLSITDYYITRKAKPNYIHLRTIENEFEELTIDKITYNASWFESRIFGADDAIEELNNLEK